MVSETCDAVWYYVWTYLEKMWYMYLHNADFWDIYYIKYLKATYIMISQYSSLLSFFFPYSSIIWRSNYQPLTIINQSTAESSLHWPIRIQFLPFFSRSILIFFRATIVSDFLSLALSVNKLRRYISHVRENVV
jgi:hypothetical protein